MTFTCNPTNDFVTTVRINTDNLKNNLSVKEHVNVPLTI